MCVCVFLLPASPCDSSFRSKRTRALIRALPFPSTIACVRARVRAWHGYNRSTLSTSANARRHRVFPSRTRLGPPWPVIWHAPSDRSIIISRSSYPVHDVRECGECNGETPSRNVVMRHRTRRCLVIPSASCSSEKRYRYLSPGDKQPSCYRV